MSAPHPVMSAFGIEIDPTQICVFPEGTTKQESLERLIGALATSNAVGDKAKFRAAVHERESIMSTGIGGGIAIPHVRIPEISYPALGIGIAPHGIEFDTLDNKPVYIIVLFATPEGADKEYLGLLAQVMVALKNETFYRELIGCRSAQEANAVINA